jgi:uncharacterized membrane protein
MNVSGWIIGPQLIGLIFLLVGLVQMRFQPPKINNYYGYRLPSAMKNQQTWDEANRFFASYLVKCSLVIIVGGIAITAGLNMIVMTVKVQEALHVMFLILTSTLAMPIILGATERHMEKTFNNKK